MKIFFDTNVIRYFGTAFRNDGLRDAIREFIVVSPVSILEAISQLSESSTRQQAFAAIQAMWNWLPAQTGMLDYPTVFIRRAVRANEEREDAESFEKISDAISQCLNAQNADELVAPATELRKLLDSTKQTDAAVRADAIRQMRANLKQERRKTLSADELKSAFVASLARRAGLPDDNAAVGMLAQNLHAYYTYDTERLVRALGNPKFNPESKKRKNDLFDSQQLLYLADHEVHFITCDTGYNHLLQQQQGDRIHLFRPDQLSTHAEAVNRLESVVL